MELKEVRKAFIEIYGEGHLVHCFHSPGRVNLIGEHTDYNGGYVLPCALDFGTYAVARKRSDNTLRFASTNSPSQIEVELSNLAYNPEDDWANYLKGVVDQFIKRGHKLGGFEILISGNIPNGAGLSSSASIELLMSVALNEMFNCNEKMLDMVLLSQKAENEFVGLNCGVMDQFAVGMGRKNHAMFLNCMSMEFAYVPFHAEGYKLVISNTNKRRGLTDSKYNERRAECETAVEMLQKELSIENLGQVSIELFEAHKHCITDPVILKRAKHVVYEDARVLASIQYLEENNLAEFGKLLNASHCSLRDDYEVTGDELDALAEEAWKVDGVLGSRMTGAGFGGCTFSLVREDVVDDFIVSVGKKYTERTHLEATFYVAAIGDGAKEC